ncbi:MAG: Lacal_2735 family protein [Flammeovirgaceae bacterium]|nr:Lacal_2735 family protein [Flammeovirgaceae bacterium]
MLKLFKKKSELEKLREKHRIKLEEAFRLSKINRQQSDQCYADADELTKAIMLLEKSKKA